VFHYLAGLSGYPEATSLRRFLERFARAGRNALLRLDDSASSGNAVGVNHQLVWDPCITGLTDLLRERRLGRLNHVWLAVTIPPGGVPVRDVDHFMFAAPGNVIFESGPHPFSLIRKLIGRSLAVTSVASDPCLAPGRQSLLSHVADFRG
jgi:predicted dehydrogenase